MKIEPTFGSSKHCAENLNRYSTAHRYPGAKAPPDREEFDEAWGDAETILRQVLALLPETVHPQRSDDPTP